MRTTKWILWLSLMAFAVLFFGCPDNDDEVVVCVVGPPQ